MSTAKNIADIKTNKLFKKNELSFQLGKFPFWLDDSMSKTSKSLIPVIT